MSKRNTAKLVQRGGCSSQSLDRQPEGKRAPLVDWVCKQKHPLGVHVMSTARYTMSALVPPERCLKTRSTAHRR